MYVTDKIKNKTNTHGSTQKTDIQFLKENAYNCLHYIYDFFNSSISRYAFLFAITSVSNLIKETPGVTTIVITLSKIHDNC